MKAVLQEASLPNVDETLPLNHKLRRKECLIPAADDEDKNKPDSKWACKCKSSQKGAGNSKYSIHDVVRVAITIVAVIDS